MLYKFTPMGYFGRTSMISRGPWFAELQVEDDGLEYYIMHDGPDGGTRYLLTNNMTYKDRTEMMRVISACNRVNYLGWAIGLAVGSTVVVKDTIINKWASGWRFATCGITAAMVKGAVCMYAGMTYGPILGAYFRKYQDKSASDSWEIRDRRREYYQIDDSQYMAYTEDDLHDIHRHANHGPQPDGEAKDASYLVELDKFLDGKPNHLKEHKRFLNYPYEFKDKSYPSLEQAKDLIEGGVSKN